MHSLGQVSFADRILLNKIDLVGQDEVNKVKLAIQSLNAAADIYTCQHSLVDITKILNIRAFDPNRNGMMLYTNNNDIFIPRDSNGKILRKNSRFTASAAARKLMAKDVISTTSLTTCEYIDVHKFDEWISALLQKDGDKIFRMKGILSMHGFDHQFVVQVLYVYVCMYVCMYDLMCYIFCIYIVYMYVCGYIGGMAISICMYDLSMHGVVH